jgi:hypothetical protein
MNRAIVGLLLVLGFGCAKDRTDSSEERIEPTKEQEPPPVERKVPAPRPARPQSTVQELTAEENEKIDSIPPPIVGPYCAGKLHSGGCVPGLEWNGVPSASGSTSFIVRTTRLPPNVSAHLVWGTEARQDPFEGGYACVGGTIHELPAQPSGGSGPCDGSVEFDLTALLQSKSDPALIAGHKVFCQVGFRDDADPAGFGTGSTCALQLILQP